MTTINRSQLFHPVFKFTKGHQTSQRQVSLQCVRAAMFFFTAIWTNTGTRWLQLHYLKRLKHPTMIEVFRREECIESKKADKMTFVLLYWALSPLSALQTLLFFFATKSTVVVSLSNKTDKTKPIKNVIVIGGSLWTCESLLVNKLCIQEPLSNSCRSVNRVSQAAKKLSVIWLGWHHILRADSCARAHCDDDAETIELCTDLRSKTPESKLEEPVLHNTYVQKVGL